MPRAAPSSLLVALAVLAGADPALAQSRCPGVAPQVTHDLTMRPAEVSLARGLAELRQMTTRPGAHPIGMYVTRLVGGPTINLASTRVEDRICIAVARVHIRFEMRERMIYVARELAPGSCEHRITLAHERQHEEIDEDAIRRRLPVNVQDMRYDFSNLATSAPVREQEANQVARDYQQRAQAIVDGMLERLFADRQHAQAAIDTPQEYQRLGNLCR